MFRNSSAIKKDKEKIDNLSEMNSINLDVLPPEVLKIIVSLLPDKDLVNLSLVNKNLNCVTKEAIDNRLVILRHQLMPQLEEQYKKIHDDNKSLQGVMSAQLDADRTLLQRIMLMLATCGVRGSYIAGEGIDDFQIRRGIRESIMVSAAGMTIPICLGLALLMCAYTDDPRDESKITLNLAAEITLVAALLTCIIASATACVMNIRLIARTCRNGSNYGTSSLRLFSGRRTEAELAHQIVALEKRMEEGEANKQEANTQKAIDAEEFNSRLRIEPLDLDVDETTPLLAARP